MKRVLRVLVSRKPTWRRFFLLIALALTSIWLWHPQFMDHLVPPPCPGGVVFDRVKIGLMSTNPNFLEDEGGSSLAGLDPNAVDQAVLRYSVSVLERRSAASHAARRGNASNSRQSLLEHEIPRVLVQTGPTRMLTRNLFLATQSVLNNVPGFRYIFFTDEEMQDYVKTRCSDGPLISAFMSLIPGAFQADLFRYCYLYHDGGVYMDLGFNRMLERNASSLVGLEALLQDAEMRNIRVIAVEDNGLGFLYNAFVVAAPRHDIFKYALDIATERILGKLYTVALHGGLLPTGPQLFRDAVMHYAFGTDVNMSVVVQDTRHTVRVIYPGRVKDVAVIRYQRHLHCLSGVVRIAAGDLGSATVSLSSSTTTVRDREGGQGGGMLVPSALVVAPLEGTLLFTKSRGYYVEGRLYFKREHYGTLWDRGPDSVYK